jgi:hypothetical protein
MQFWRDCGCAKTTQFYNENKEKELVQITLEKELIDIKLRHFYAVRKLQAI